MSVRACIYVCMHACLHACACESAYVCVCVVLCVCVHVLPMYNCKICMSMHVMYYQGTGKLFDVGSRKCQAKLEGHEGDVSKVVFLVTRCRMFSCEFVSCRSHLIHKAQGSSQPVVTKQLGYGM